MPEQKRWASARYALPDVVNPNKRRCIQIQVPDNIFHLAAFYGQMWALARAYSWGNDEAHTALEVAKVWQDVFDGIRVCEPCNQIGTGADEGVEQLIRQNPDNPCELQTSIDGTHWCTFADLSLCTPGSGQPGSGSPQPPPNGGSACYNAVLQGSGKWLLPTQVNTGDIITITDVSGAATDGTTQWFCPNGQNFFLGSCGGGTFTNSGDPLNTAPHMKLIAKINGVYYEMYNATFTVPSGVSLNNVEFQLNDGTLSDNYGQIVFKACVQNNQAGTFTHTFDFTLNDGGFVQWGTGNPATWTPGTGWVTTSPATIPTTVIKRDLAAAHTFTYMEMTFIKNDPVAADPIFEFCTLNVASSTIFNDYTKAAGTGTLTVSGSGSLSGAQISAHLGGHFNATYTITKMVVSGIGADPF